MVEIKSFKAVIYNKDKVKSLNQVTAPPYDVISLKERNALYKKSPYNVVRLILGKIYKSDVKSKNRYTRAAAFIKSWIKKDILQRDADEAIYVYLQNFYDPRTKKRVKRLGFIALFELQDFKKKNIYPHEWTLSKPKVDRFELIKAASCNYSPVFSLYSDKEKKVDKFLKKALKSKPLIKTIDADKTIHAVYALKDDADVQDVIKLMNKKKLFIADGHHRYETALNYKKYVKKLGKKAAGINSSSTLMYFTNLEDTGLRIYPIQRALRNISLKRLENLTKNLERYFEIKTVKDKDRMLKEVLASKSSDYVFGMYLKRKFYILRLLDKKTAALASKRKKPTCVDRLNVSLLHNLIIKDMLKADFEEDAAYLKKPEAIIEEVNKKKDRVGFFVTAITANDITEAALNGERMPRKTTYFYPKLYSGLVINKMSRP